MLFALATLHGELGHHALAIQILLNVVSADHTMAQAWNSLGVNFMQVNDFDQADVALLNALEEQGFYIARASAATRTREASESLAVSGYRVRASRTRSCPVRPAASTELGHPKWLHC